MDQETTTTKVGWMDMMRRHRRRRETLRKKLFQLRLMFIFLKYKKFHDMNLEVKQSWGVCNYPVVKEWTLELHCRSLDPSSTLQKWFNYFQLPFLQLENEDNNKSAWHIQIKVEKCIQLSNSDWYDLCRQNIQIVGWNI